VTVTRGFFNSSCKHLEGWSRCSRPSPVCWDVVAKKQFSRMYNFSQISRACVKSHDLSGVELILGHVNRPSSPLSRAGYKHRDDGKNIDGPLADANSFLVSGKGNIMGEDHIRSLRFF
jgi:hypothetical protein